MEQFVLADFLVMAATLVIVAVGYFRAFRNEKRKD